MQESGTTSTTEIEKKPVVSKHYYHDVFVQEINNHFGYPCSDTCDICDCLATKQVLMWKACKKS